MALIALECKVDLHDILEFLIFKTIYYGLQITSYFWCEILALIYNFTREITKLLWQPFFDTINK